jgi:hypothetical protein
MSRLLNTARYTSCCVLVSTESLVELSEITSSGPYQFAHGSHSEQTTVVPAARRTCMSKGTMRYSKPIGAYHLLDLADLPTLP